MSLSILVAPSGFKESMDAEEAASAIAQGVRKALPDARVLMAPMADGGEGFTRALIKATGGRLLPLRVTGPLGTPVQSFFGFLGGKDGKTAVIEMAAAAGLSLVPRDRRDPARTTSFGVGELILAAIDAGAERILLGCGDSGINDGGAGMAQALGARLLDREGKEIGFGGGALHRLAAIDPSGLDPRLKGVKIDVACNWSNLLLGPRGVARVFGPQKGATPAQVAVLEKGLETYAGLIHRVFGLDLGEAPGSGASGGLGAGLVAFAGATLHPRFEVVMRYLSFDALLAEADLVITAEGALDGQSPHGKVPCEVARRARAAGIPTVVLAGTIGKGVTDTFAEGVDAFASILKRPCSLEEAIAKGEKFLRRAAEDALRMLLVGYRLAGRPAAPRLKLAA